MWDPASHRGRYVAIASFRDLEDYLDKGNIVYMPLEVDQVRHLLLGERRSTQ